MKNKKNILFLSITAVLALVSCFLIVLLLHSKNNSNHLSAQASSADNDFMNSLDNSGGDYTYHPPTLTVFPGVQITDPANSNEDVESESSFVPTFKMDLNPSSLTVFVNKEYALPKDYKPENLVTPDVLFNILTYDERTMMRPEAAEALEKLFTAAQRDGYVLYGVSGYRSYDRQYKIFTNNIALKGKVHTLKYSAVPGTSEHQTGLAIDVSTESLNFKLDAAFADSGEGIWLSENAYLYGYIIRYPTGASNVTGYAYEPWHIRYVGNDLAKYLYENKLTFEDYCNYIPSADFDFETVYAEIINYHPPVVTLIPEEDDNLLIGEDGQIIDGELTEEDIPVEELPADNALTGTPTPVPKEQDPEPSEDPPEEDPLPDDTEITGTPIPPTPTPEIPTDIDSSSETEEPVTVSPTLSPTN
ncbi:MAG: M15 family metallopeptidase [Mobilitalea sp.]